MKNLTLKDIKIEKKESDLVKSTAARLNIKKKDMAVIGISIKAGSADNADEFWNILTEGKTDLHYADKQRVDDFFNHMDANGYIGNKDQVRFKKFTCMKDVDKFDGYFFRINPAEARLMDPIQRLFLQTSYHALEDAGYGAANIKGKNIGVFVGYSEDDVKYSSIFSLDDDEGKILTGNMASIIPSRISYIMDLKGPAMSIDTGCSSSLTALYQAMESIYSGSCEMAVVGGIRYNYVLPILNCGQLDIFSSDGRTRAFDDNSEGTNNGEASCAIVIKQLSKAIEDNDNIYAVIKGSAINNDGATVGITAPNMEAQSQMIAQAWQSAGVDPETISYVECHGTGTHIGDPIEANALIRAFEKYTDKKQFCAIGSSKSNFSHSGPASGIVGIIKEVLSIKNKVIPPTVNFDVPNASVDFIDSPVYVNIDLRKWTSPVRRCGLNAFSMNGTNVHFVLEEYNSERRKAEEDKYKILSISAVKIESLSELVKDYISFLKKNPGISLSDFVYTVNTSRKICEYRTAIVFETRQQLIDELEKYSAQLEDVTIEPVRMKKSTEEAEKLLAECRNSRMSERQPLERLMEIWCEGYDINWSLMYDKNRYHRVSAPVYPFVKERCWYEFSGRNRFENELLKNCRSLIESEELPQELQEKLSGFADDFSKIVGSEKTDDEQIILLGRDGGEYTEAERFIAQKCYETFGYREININDSFSTFNNDSLQMSTLFGKIRSAYNINMTDLYKYDSISSLAASIEDTGKDIYAMADMIMDMSDKMSQVVPLEEYYKADIDKYNARTDSVSDLCSFKKVSYDNILLTGAAGYLGVYILRELLVNTSSAISLIVRAGKNITAEERVRVQVSKYFSSDLYDEYADRITVYEGDLVKNNFGLDKEYDELVQAVDCVIHCAANSSHFGDYSQFYDGNVTTTENVIMFAETGRKKVLNHISTYATGVFTGSGKGIYFTEFDDVDTEHIDDVEGYYPKTKIISEKLIQFSRQRGTDARIFRVDDILFEYERGIMQENINNNAIALIIKSFIELGMIPDIDGFEYEFSYVDYTAKAIALLVSLSDMPVNNFHIGNSVAVDLRACLSDSTLDIHTDVVPLKKFLDTGIELFEKNDPKYGLFNQIVIHGMNGGKIDLSYRASEVGSELTRRILEKQNFAWPALTSEAMNKFLAHCEKVGFISKRVYI